MDQSQKEREVMENEYRIRGEREQKEGLELHLLGSCLSIPPTWGKSKQRAGGALPILFPHKNRSPFLSMEDEE